MSALHHVTAVCSDARRTVRFYRDELGLRLVKKTVNFDDPDSYHLYFGDELGRPGTLVTFFEWPHARRGRLGHGLVETIALALPGEREVRRIEDPDGLRLELHPGERIGLRGVTAYGDPSLYEGLIEPDSPLRVVAGPAERGLVGAGITHHIAWRTQDEQEQVAWRLLLVEAGFRPTEVLDRKYFRSIYFRMPDGLLLELATDGPGFTVDERAESLGQGLALPAWLEPERGRLEEVLAPL